MNRLETLEKKTFSYLHSMFILLVTAYYLEPAIFNSYFSISFRKSYLGIATLVVLIVIRICFYSGVYGFIVELVSGQEIIFSIDRFKSNLREYYKMYILLAIIPVLIYFSLFLSSSDFGISFISVTTMLDVLVLFIISYFIIYKKYIKALRIPVKEPVINAKVIYTLIFISATSIILVKLAIFSESREPYFHLYRVVIFLLKYAHFFTFIYISLLVLESHSEIKRQLCSERELFLIAPPSTAVVPAIVSWAWRFYPPVFVVLRALTPKYYKIREFNQVIWRERYYQANKLVAITCFTSNSPEAYKIAKEFKKRGSKVVMGGPHVSFLSDEALEYCDSVVIGEAEGVWEDVLRDYESGVLKKKYVGPVLKDYYKKTVREMQALPAKIVSRCIETGRGCKFNCFFCAIPGICGSQIRKIPVPDIISIVAKARQEQKTFLFLDNNIYSEPFYAKELFKALIPLKIKWAGSCSIDMAKDDEALRLARLSGCRQLLLGYEISNSSVEKSRGGKFSLADDYRRLTRKIYKAGISIKAHFIYGFDSDGIRAFFNLWKFCLSLFPFFTIISFLTPLPGSKLFNEMLRERRLVNFNWRNYSLTTFVFKPKHINIAVFNWLYPVVCLWFLGTTSMGGQFLFLGLILYYTKMIRRI